MLLYIVQCVFGNMIKCTVAMVAHGRVVTSSPQITEVKQRLARLVLGWVTGAQVTLPAMCRDVGQTFHMIVNGNCCRKCAEFSQRRLDRTREEFQYQ